MKQLLFVLAAGLFAGNMSAQTFSYVQFYPDGYGQFSNSFPFNSPDRLQEIIPASIFSGVNTQLPITQLAYKISVNPSQADPLTLNNIKVQLATSPNSVNNASTVFASNLGIDAKTVFSGSVTLANAVSVNLNTASFNMLLNLSTPFFYDPSKGDLTLDVTYNSPNDTVYKTVASGPWASTPAGPVVYGRVIYALGTDAASGTLDYLAPDMRFTVGSVPEPSTVAFSGLALGIGAIAHKKQRQLRANHD